MAEDYLVSYSLTAAANTSIGGINIQENQMTFPSINNAIREQMSHLKGFKNEFEKGADIASATALPINVAGLYHDVTGTTTVTSFAAPTNDTSHFKILQFDGALTLTHSSSLVLLTGANRTTVAGDTGAYFYDGTNWIEVFYNLPASFDIANVAFINQLQTFTAAQRTTVTALTPTTNTYTPTLDTSNDFSATLENGVSNTMANPSDIDAGCVGQSGDFIITQNGTGASTLAWGSYYKNTAGESFTDAIGSTLSGVTTYSYRVISATHIELIKVGTVA